MDREELQEALGRSRRITFEYNGNKYTISFSLNEEIVVSEHGKGEIETFISVTELLSNLTIHEEKFTDILDDIDNVVVD